MCGCVRVHEGREGVCEATSYHGIQNKRVIYTERKLLNALSERLIESFHNSMTEFMTSMAEAKRVQKSLSVKIPSVSH